MTPDQRADARLCLADMWVKRCLCGAWVWYPPILTVPCAHMSPRGKETKHELGT